MTSEHDPESSSPGTPHIADQLGAWATGGPSPSPEALAQAREINRTGASKLRAYERVLVAALVEKVQRLRRGLDHVDQVLLDPEFISGLRESPTTLLKTAQVIEERLRESLGRIAGLRDADPSVHALLQRAERHGESSELRKKLEEMGPSKREAVRRLFQKIEARAELDSHDETSATGMNGVTG